MNSASKVHIEASGPAPPWTAVAITLLLLALLCCVAYAPALTIPLLEDDYPNITQAQAYGPLASLPALFHDAVFRLRATSYWTMYLLWQAFHLKPSAYHLASLALHVANMWLVYFFALHWLRARPAAAFAAMFFAVYEGHQEAVMWVSAINELLMVFFGLGALLCTSHRWTRPPSRQHAWTLQLTGMILFALALLSKESAVIFLPLFFLTFPETGWRRSILPLLPYCLLAALTLASIAASRNSSFRFTDGSFSINAPFWITWPRGFGRMLWIWGLFSAAVVLFLKEPGLNRAARFALLWIGVTLVPYSFLTYSTQIPSRQTYLAAVGLSLWFGAAVAHLSKRLAPGRKLVTAVIVLMVTINIGYLWTTKRRQFLKRAEPTEQLIVLARYTDGPIWVRCFPRPGIVAEEAVRLAVSRPPSSLIWSESEAARRKPAAVFCYNERGSQ